MIRLIRHSDDLPSKLHVSSKKKETGVQLSSMFIFIYSVQLQESSLSSQPHVVVQTDFFPVNQVPERIQVRLPIVLPLEVICVFPHIHS